LLQPGTLFGTVCQDQKRPQFFYPGAETMQLFLFAGFDKRAEMAFHNPPHLFYIFPFRFPFHTNWLIIIGVFLLSETHKN
jgi:hypothetical protein